MVLVDTPSRDTIPIICFKYFEYKFCSGLYVLYCQLNYTGSIVLDADMNIETVSEYGK
jgi:hypothetical protein